MGVRQAATILFPDNLDNLSEKAGKFKLGHGGKFYMIKKVHKFQIF